MARHFTAYQSLVWGTTSFRLFWSRCLLWAPFNLFLHCKKQWKIGLSPSWATHDFITFCDIPLSHIFLRLSNLWLLRSHLCRRCCVLLITFVCIISSSAFFPHLRAEVSEMHIELRRTVLWGLLWWHSAVLLGSLLSRLLITAGCLLSCGLILTQWVFRLLP